VTVAGWVIIDRDDRNAAGRRKPSNLPPTDPSFLSDIDAVIEISKDDSPDPLRAAGCAAHHR
jgi:hypothetical protein